MNTVRKYCKDEKECLLIVEGINDCHSIFRLAEKNGCETLFGIWEGGNDAGALERFGGLLVATTPQRPRIMGIVLDADIDQEDGTKGSMRRWSQIASKLRDSGYEVPSQPSPNGTIIQGLGGRPKVGVWLMPDNQNAGMLEDFLLELAPRKTVDYVRTCVQTARDAGYTSYKDRHESKAIAYTYLAWQNEPGNPFGIAVKAKFFDANSQSAANFIAWLKNLFETVN